jgi:hypothetical protein
MTVIARSVTLLVSAMVDREREPRALASLRNAFLSKLISGELHVTRAEKPLEKVK